MIKLLFGKEGTNMSQQEILHRELPGRLVNDIAQKCPNEHQQFSNFWEVSFKKIYSLVLNVGEEFLKCSLCPRNVQGRFFKNTKKRANKHL